MVDNRIIKSKCLPTVTVNCAKGNSCSSAGLVIINLPLSVVCKSFHKMFHKVQAQMCSIVIIKICIKHCSEK